MGTAFSVDVRDEVTGRDAVELVATWWRWVDATFSTYRAGSEISRLGRGELRVAECSPEVGAVLDLCAQAAVATDGYFSATTGGRLDPSGLVKGWAVDLAGDLLRRGGSSAHAISAGGDVLCAGEPEPGREWQIGIADPLRPGWLAAVVHGRDVAVATSGTAERGGHVHNPFTGEAGTDLASVSVVAESLASADALATAALARGRGCERWLEGVRGVEAFGVWADGTRWWTGGFGRCGTVCAGDSGYFHLG